MKPAGTTLLEGQGVEELQPERSGVVSVGGFGRRLWLGLPLPAKCDILGSAQNVLIYKGVLRSRVSSTHAITWLRMRRDMLGLRAPWVTRSTLMPSRSLNSRSNRTNLNSPGVSENSIRTSRSLSSDCSFRT